MFGDCEARDSSEGAESVGMLAQVMRNNQAFDRECTGSTVSEQLQLPGVLWETCYIYIFESRGP